MYRSAGLLNELRKVEEARQLNDYRQQAFRDALQWKIIANDKEEENVMFMSQVDTYQDFFEILLGSFSHHLKTFVF